MSNSQELVWMLENKMGFRSESYGGSNTILIENIIKYEMLDLGNNDIVDFFKEHYGLEFLYCNYGTMLEKRQYTEEIAHNFIEQIMDILKKKFGHSNIFGLWLSTEQGVIKNYADKDEEVISKYDLSGTSFYPISDLGEQGALFALEINPHFLPVKEIGIATENLS